MARVFAPSPAPHHHRWRGAGVLSSPWHTRVEASRVGVACAASHYDALGVDPLSSDDDIKIAFRRAAKAYHPDVNKEPGAQARFVRINEAYQTLSDPVQRAEYNQELRRQEATAQSPWGHVNAVQYTWVVDDDSDSEDEDDVNEYLEWATKGNNYRASFQSSWQANAKRRQRQAAERRAAAEREERRRAHHSASARCGGRSGVGQRAGSTQTARHSGGRRGQDGARGSRGGGVGGFSKEDILSSLGPEARTTAQNVFGRNLEGLETVEQLSDFMDVLDVLQSDMGIEFDVLNEGGADGSSSDASDGDDGDMLDALLGSGAHASGRTRRGAGRGAGARGSSHAATRHSTGPGDRGADAAPGRGPCRGSRRRTSRVDWDWDAFVSDFDTGRGNGSRDPPASTTGRGPHGAGPGHHHGHAGRGRRGSTDRAHQGVDDDNAWWAPPPRPSRHAPGRAGMGGAARVGGGAGAPPRGARGESRDATPTPSTRSPSTPSARRPRPQPRPASAPPGRQQAASAKPWERGAGSGGSGTDDADGGAPSPKDVHAKPWERGARRTAAAMSSSGEEELLEEIFGKWETASARRIPGRRPLR